MYLSYSGFKTYEQCPLAYWHKYVNKTATPTPDNGINALYGSVVGNVFEAFYRDRIWKHPDFLDRLQAMVEPCYDLAIKNQKGRIYDWSDEKANYHSKEEVLADVRETIPRGVNIIRQNRLLGPQADAEVKLDARFGEHMIGGRADFLIKRIEPHRDLVLLDGKGSKHREKYVDGAPKKAGQEIEGTQLKWYAVLHRSRMKFVPDGLGYIFWRFEDEKAIEWVSFTTSDLDRLEHEVVSTMDRISNSTARLEKASGKRQEYDELRQELFPAQAGDGCRFCSFLDLCEEGTKKMKSGRKKPRATLPTDGVVEPGLCLDDD
jgi:hypothetical protein